MGAVDSGLQVLFPPPGAPPPPPKAERIRKEAISLETVFNNGELLRADIDDGFDLDDDEFYKLVGMVPPSQSSEERSQPDESVNESVHRLVEPWTGLDALSLHTGLSSVGNSHIESLELCNLSIADRHTGGVLQHHFYSPSAAGGEQLSSFAESDALAEDGLKLPPIAQSWRDSNPAASASPSPKPLYLKAVDDKTRRFINSLSESPAQGSRPATVSAGTLARIRSEQDARALAGIPQTTSLPNFSPFLPSNHLPTVKGASPSPSTSIASNLEEDLRLEFQHSTNSYVDSEMARNIANQAKFGRYQRTYHVDDVVTEHWNTFSERHISAIEAATAGNCVPTIYLPHGDEEKGVNPNPIESVKDATKKIRNSDVGEGEDDDDDDDDDEFKKLGLQSGVVLAAKTYSDVWGVLTDRNSSYPHISNSHPTLPTTIRFTAEREMKERERLREDLNEFGGHLTERSGSAGSARSVNPGPGNMQSPASAISKPSPAPSPSPLREVASEVRKMEKVARDKLLSQMKKRWQVDIEGELEAQKRVQEYLEKSQQEEKKILHEYLSVMDDW